MNYLHLFLINLVFLTTFCNCESDERTTEANPEIIDEEFFSFILYVGLTKDILEPIRLKLNNNFNRILADMELDSIKKLTVRIWKNETNFLDDMENSIGQRYVGSSGWVYSSSDIRILYRSDNTAQIALHEFCHAVSLVVNNTIGNNPRWLWEAIAIYESGEFVDPTALSYLVSGNFPTLSELNSDFNTGNYKIYSVGYILSEFIITNWNKTQFVNLIKSNGNIQQTLGISTQQFEESWKEFVINKYF